MTDHSTWDQLVDFAEERLPEWEAHALVEHLDQCEACAADVEWLQTVLARLDADPSDESSFRPRWYRRYPTWDQLRPSKLYRSTNARWSLLLIGVLLVMSLLMSRSPAEFVAGVQTFSGTAHIAEPAGTAQPLAPNHSVMAGDIVSTGKDGEVKLNFGERAVALTLYPESEVEISQIRSSNGALERLAVKQVAGVAEANVQDGTLVLYSADNVFSTRSGLFKVRQLPSGTMVLTVESGKVLVTYPAGSQSIGEGGSLILPVESEVARPSVASTAGPSVLLPTK